MRYFEKIIATPTKNPLKPNPSPPEITSANKDRALGRLRGEPDAAVTALFEALVNCKSAVIKGFPGSVQENITALHRLRWMNEALSETAMGVIRSAIALQITETVLPQVVLSLNHPDSWEIPAIQSLFYVSSIPMVLPQGEPPYVRFYLKCSKVIWNVQQGDAVLFAGTSKPSAFIAQAKHTIDFSIANFLRFKQAGKRTSSNKVLMFQSQDGDGVQSFSRQRLDRNGVGAKGIQNHTRLLDVDSYEILTAHRPDGELHDYDIDLWLSSAQRGQLKCKHKDVMHSLRSLIRTSLIAKKIIDDTHKVLTVFASEIEATQWISVVFQTAQHAVPAADGKCPSWVSRTALWGPNKIAPLRAVLLDLVKKENVYLDTDI